MFSVNPYGVQRESLVSGGGDALNPTWDVKWQSEGKIYSNYYILELAIPFSSLKFKEGSQIWRFQTYRWDLQTDEQSAWSRVPQNQLLINLAFLGEMHFEKPLGKNRPPVYIIPYLNTSSGTKFSKSTKSRVVSYRNSFSIFRQMTGTRNPRIRAYFYIITKCSLDLRWCL